MNTAKPIRYLILLVLLLGIILPLYGQAKAGVTVLSERVETDNRVEAQVAVFDGLGKVLPDLTTDSFTISEPVADLNITSSRARPVVFAIILNQAFLTSEGWAAARGVLNTYIQDYFQEGDTVILSYYSVANVQEVKELNAPQSINLALDEVAIGQGEDTFNSDIASRVVSAVERAQNSGDFRAAHALYISQRMVKRGDTQAGLQRFTSVNIPLHILDVDTRQQNKEFAGIINGIYMGLVGNNNFEDAENTALIANRLPVFALMDESRTLYTIRYQATSLDTNERTVSISTTQGSDNFSYQPNFSKPSLTDFKGNLDISRTFTSANSSELTPKNNVFNVRITFDSPPSLVRRLQSLVMNVYDANTLSGSFPADSLTPDANGNYSITWPLDSYTTPDSNAQVQVQVVATDETGTQINSERLPVSVTVGKVIDPTEPTLFFTKINQNIRRNFISQTALDSDTLQTLTMQLTLPDSSSAIPSQASLVIKNLDGTPLSTERQSLQPDAREVQMTWDIADFNQPSTKTQVLIQGEIELDDGTKLTTTEETFTVTVGDPLPAAPWMFADLLGGVFELVGVPMPFDAKANVPTLIFTSALGIGLTALFLRKTRAGQAITTQAVAGLNKTVQVMKTATQRIGPVSPAQVIATLDWQGSGKTGSIPINREMFIIGRDMAEGCHAAIPLAIVSGQHFRVFFLSDEQRFTIEDMGSTNHTYLKDMRLASGRAENLFDGDEILIAQGKAEQVTIAFKTSYRRTMQINPQENGNGHVHTKGLHDMGYEPVRTMDVNRMDEQPQPTLREEEFPVVDDIDAEFRPKPASVQPENSSYEHDRDSSSERNQNTDHDSSMNGISFSEDKRGREQKRRSGL